MKGRSLLRTVGFVALSVMMVLGFLVARELGVFHPRPAPHPTPAETRDGRWEQDIDYFASELPRLHFDLFASLTAAEFAAAISDLRREISVLTDEEIQLRLAQIITAVGDGHTSLSGWTEGDLMVPMRMWWFPDGLFVVRVAVGHEHLFGGQVLGIEDSDVETTYGVVTSVVSADNEVHRRRRSASLMRNLDVLHLLGLSSEPDRASFTVRSHDGDTVVVSLTGTRDEVEWAELQTNEVPLYRRQPHQPYWYEVIPEASILFFKYNQCVLRDEFREFAKGLKERIAAGGIDRIVVDFRGNGGGASALFSSNLLGFLRRHEHLNREGHLYSIIDGGTFSSAVLNSVALERETNAITVGEPTGGKPNHFGEVRAFTLPNSGLIVRYSTKYFRTYPELGDAPSFPPEIMISLSSRDFFDGRDPVLTWILARHVAEAP